MSSKSLTPITAAAPAIPPDLASAVDRVNSYHTACVKSFGDQMGYAFLAGRELISLKDKIAHGHFVKFRELYFPKLPERSARRYVQFAEALTKSATVADLPAVGNLRLITNGGAGAVLDDREREKVLKAVHDFADGKTLTQLYRDLEVIRDAQPLGRRPGEGGRKKLSLAEQAELLQSQAVEDWADLADDLDTYAHKFTVLADADCEAQIAVLDQALKARRAWLKQPKNKRDPQAIETMFEDQS